jgi:hypothetical protein
MMRVVVEIMVKIIEFDGDDHGDYHHDDHDDDRRQR